MKKILLLISCVIFGGLTVIAQSGAEYLSMADKSYDAGDKEKAKLLYEKAAALNNPDAHYALAYKYVLSKGASIYHYSEAAKLGHPEATSEVFQALFFRSESLTTTNPELAYDIYTQAKKANPDLHFFWDEDEVKVLQQCIEVDPFDVKEFIHRYKITDKDTSESPYAIWELAAEASRNGRFGHANPKLVLQLVCRGGFVPAEVMSAVQEAYQNWKDTVVTPFDPCDYVGSGIGLAYCSEKASAKAEMEYQAIVKKMAGQLKNNAGPLLKQAYADARNFIEAKAFKEEGSDGFGHVAWANESADSQKANYTDLIKKVNKGFRPKLTPARNYDGELNAAYKSISAGLRKESIKGGFYEITDNDIKHVQRLWIRYRDSSAKLFAKIEPSVTEQEWKNYLTEIRTGELKEINELRQ